MRIRWSFRNELAPDFGCLLALPILLGGRTEVIASTYDCVVERYGAHEGASSFVRHNSIRLRHQGFAEIGFAIRSLTE